MKPVCSSPTAKPMPCSSNLKNNCANKKKVKLKTKTINKTMLCKWCNNSCPTLCTWWCKTWWIWIWGWTVVPNKTWECHKHKWWELAWTWCLSINPINKESTPWWTTWCLWCPCLTWWCNNNLNNNHPISTLCITMCRTSLLNHKHNKHLLFIINHHNKPPTLRPPLLHWDPI